jgi:hypothetical protein
MLDKSVIEAAIKLREHKVLHFELFSRIIEADDNNIYSLDLLVAATLNRSASLLRGFCDLIESENYLCAVPLLRLQADNCLRFFASSIVPDHEKFAVEVFEGKSIRKMKDRKGQLLTDKYLCDQVALSHPWIAAVYDRASGYVHLSDQHFFNAIRTGTEENTLDMKVTDHDSMVSVNEYLQVVDAFRNATDLLFELMERWATVKVGYKRTRGMPGDSPAGNL